MWEIMCANIDFSNKILISHCSTALYTPKFIFDQEPIVIFLFDMLVDDVLQSLNQMHAFEIFVDRLKETYRDKEKVFLPKSKEELLEYLEKVLSKNE